MFLEKGFPPDWSTHKKLIWQAALSSSSLPWATFSGNPLQFRAQKAHTLKSVSVAFTPKQEGSGDPSPDNVRPISGWNSLDINRAGENLSLPIDGMTVYQPTETYSHVALPFLENGIIICNISISDNIVYKAGPMTTTISIQDGVVTFKTSNSSYGIGICLEIPHNASLYYGADSNNTATQSRTVQFYDADGNYLGGTGYNPSSFTVPENAKFAVFCFRTISGTDTTVEKFWVSPTNSGYVAPSPISTTTLSFGQTVYGGTAEVAEDGTGTGTDEWYYEEFDGSSDEAWVIDQSNSSYFAIFNRPQSVSNYDLTQIGNWCGGGGNLYTTFGKYRAQTNGAIAVGNKYGSEMKFSTVTEFKAYIAEHPIQVSYKVATPTPFTPTVTGQQPTAVQGINTIWSNANGDVTVEARAEAVNLSASQSLNMLLGGRYVNNHTAEDLSDEEALDIILNGGQR